MNKKSIIGNQPTETTPETPEKLESMLVVYGRMQTVAKSRKDRLADLMQRSGASKWDPKKKAQMVRRLVEATNGADQLGTLVDQLQHRLQQITTAA